VTSCKLGFGSHPNGARIIVKGTKEVGITVQEPYAVNCRLLHSRDPRKRRTRVDRRERDQLTARTRASIDLGLIMILMTTMSIVHAEGKKASKRQGGWGGVCNRDAWNNGNGNLGREKFPVGLGRLLLLSSACTQSLAEDVFGTLCRPNQAGTGTAVCVRQAASTSSAERDTDL
jgi:YD repeat-containing protein